jgi:hypothetical protein
VSAPQYARITRRELGEIPPWADQLLDHLQEQIENLTRSDREVTQEAATVKLRTETWTTVLLQKMKKPARSVFSSQGTVLEWQSTSEPQKYLVKVHQFPVQSAPVVISGTTYQLPAPPVPVEVEVTLMFFAE